jgi:hypothetical protein
MAAGAGRAGWRRGRPRVRRAALGVGELASEFADAGSGGGVVHGAVLERGVVPGDGGLGGGDLVGDGGEFGVPVVGGGVALGVGAFDHGGQDGFGGGVEVVQRVEDEGVEFVGG